ncbi:hypothetical protein [Rufibacter tibetensis]|uniref:hypothetical protein n=1 Tax=Rufibacter tibetensis TaxID=512763 RepID=UPI0012F7298F|nr:hypothetical protein [Rufibacter tibetensis]
MVKITNAAPEGEGLELELTAGCEVVECQVTGEPFLVAKACRVPAGSNAESAALLRGATLPGILVKVAVEPYQYRDPSTKRTLTLRHGYAYKPHPRDETQLGLTQVGET